MPTLLEIYNDPNYKNANEATKRAIFEKYSGKDTNYSNANDATKAAIRQKFGIEDIEEPELKKPEKDISEKVVPKKEKVSAEVTKRENPFVGSAEAGYERLKGELGLLAGKVGLMKPEEAEKYQAEQEAKAAQIYTPSKEGWKEAPFTKLGELAGGSLPYMVAPLAVGAGAALAPEAALAGTIGVGATSALQFTGSNLARQMEANQQSLSDTSLLKAGAAAVPQAALDVIGFKATPFVRQIFGKAGINLSEEAAQEVVKKNLLATAGNYAKATGKAMGTEGITEAGQQVLERLQAGLNIADEEARREYFDSFVGGAVLGGALAVPGHAIERAVAKVKEQPAPTTPAPTTTPTTPTPTPTPAATTAPAMVTSTEDAQSSILGGIENVRTDGGTTGSSVTILRGRRAEPTTRATKESTTDTTGMGGAGSDTAGAQTRTAGEYTALGQVEQNLADNLKQSGKEFKAPAHVRNYVIKNIFNGDKEAANKLEVQNPGLYKRLFEALKAAPTTIPVTEQVQETTEQPADTTEQVQETTPITNEQDQVETDNALTVQQKQARLEQLRLRDEAKQKFEQEKEAERQAFMAEEPTRIANMEQAEAERIERAYPVKSIFGEATTQDTTEAKAKKAVDENIDELTVNTYEEERSSPEATEEDGKGLPAWNKLSAIERAYYNVINKTQGIDEAIKALKKFISTDGLSENEKRANQESGFYYETNRATAEKEHDIKMPSWKNLSAEGKQLFTNSINAARAEGAQLRGADLHTTFGELASQLEAENVAYRGMRPTAVAETQNKLQEKTSKELSQRDIAVERTIIEQQRARKERREGKAKGKKQEGWKAILTAASEGALDEVVLGAARVRSATNVITKRLLDIINKLDVDLNIEFGTIETGEPGLFNPSTNTIIIDRNNLYSAQYDDEGRMINEDTRSLSEVVLHEVTHYLLDHVVDNVNTLTDRQQKAVQELHKMFKHIKNVRLGNNQTFGNQFNIPTLKEFLAELISNSAMQVALGNVDVVNKSDATRWNELNDDERELFTPLQKVKNIASAFMQRVAAALGFQPNEAPLLISALTKVEDILKSKEYALPTPEVRGKGISYAGGRRKAPTTPRTADDIIKEAENAIPDTPKLELAKFIWSKIREPRKTYRNLVFTFQNTAAPLKYLQNAMDLKGETRRNQAANANGETEFNNTYELQSTMASKASVIFHETVGDLHNTLIKQLRELRNIAKGQTLKKLLAAIDSYAQALHEPERRRILFLKSIKLRDDVSVKLANGRVFKASDLKEEIFRMLDERVLTRAQRKGLRKLLDDLVFTDKGNLKAPTADARKGKLNKAVVDTKYYANKPDLMDENNIEYSPVNNLTPAQVDSILDKMYKDTTFPYAKVQEIFNTLREIEEKSKELYRKGNHWSHQVDNYVDFYGFDFYVPYKGRPESALEKADNLFYSDKDPLSKRYSEYVRAMGGRASAAENIVAQIITDARKAAFSIPANQVTESVANNIKQGHITTTVKNRKPYKTVQFKDRATALTSEDLQKRNAIFHYRPNGVIDIYLLKENDPVLKALRPPYRNYSETGTRAWNALGTVTRWIGQGYTLFQVKFPPYNFVRDVLFNLYNITVDFGPMVSAKTLANTVKMTVIDTMLMGGMFKSGKAAYLYQEGNITELKKLAARDSFYADFLTLAQKGGVVTMLQGASGKIELRRLVQDLGRGNIVRGKDAIVSVFQYWFNMFELTARMGAFNPLKEAIKKEYPNLTLDEINEKAAYEVKNLTNFEQSGRLGMEMGNLFMFSRASATGSTRFMDSVSYILPIKSALEIDLSEADRANQAVVAEYTKNYNKKAKRARLLAATMLGFGYAIYSMMLAGSDDDELDDNKVAKDDAALWARNARVPLKGAEQKKVAQIPWGFGFGTFAAIGAQLAILNNGNQTYGEFMSNSTQILLDSYLPLPISRISFKEHPLEAIADTLTPSFARGFIEYMANINGLGQEIYDDNNLSNRPDAFKGGSSIPDWLKKAAIGAFDISDGGIDIDPNSAAFFLTSYLNGAYDVANMIDNVAMVMDDDKSFDAKTDSIVAGSFIGKLPDYESGEFNRVEEQIKQFKKTLTGKDILGKKDEYLIENNPDVLSVINIYDKLVSSQLRDLRAERNSIENTQGIPYKDKKESLDRNTLEQRLLKKRFIHDFKMLAPELKSERDKD